MKKLVLVAAMLLATTFAQAESFVHGQYTFRDTIAGQAGEPNRQGVNLTVGNKLDNGITLDAGVQVRSQNGETGSNTTRLETGASYQLPVSQDFAIYTRGAVGYKLTDADDFGYYSIEPGVKWQVAQPLNVGVGYRYRDAFSDANKDKTNTVRLGAEYALAKDKTITLGLDRSYGDSEFLGLNVGYAVKF